MLLDQFFLIPVKFPKEAFKLHPTRLKRQLVVSLIMPIFTYCDSVFAIAMDSSCSRRLEVAYNSCIRLVCSVAHETGAVLIHVDPQRTEGDIPLNQLAGMITKIAKSAQPTIILVDNCHLMYRKKEKGVTIEPSPYTKMVSKLKKGINRKFRILMIGATDKPELVNGGKMSKVFDKIIPFPYKDYHASADYWGKYLFRNDALSRSFPYPGLVEATKTYKTPDLTLMFSDMTMTSKRKKDLIQSPLKISEFVEPLKAVKALETTSDTIKMPTSAYAWASTTYKSLKARKKMLKELLDERLGKLQDTRDKKKKK